MWPHTTCRRGMKLSLREKHATCGIGGSINQRQLTRMIHLIHSLVKDGPKPSGVQLYCSVYNFICLLHTVRYEPSLYSTVTDFARFLGWSTLHPRATAMW